MRGRGCLVAALHVAIAFIAHSNAELTTLATESGVGPWVDVDTPAEARSYVSSRGDTWELVMSDEFSDTRREFQPGRDHLWTSLERPDGVNGAYQLYSHNMTYVDCDVSADGNRTCSLVLKVIDEVNNVTVYNLYTRPPSSKTATFFYRSAMLQSWNKFCFQGGMIEARAVLPGAINDKTRNPDLKKGFNARVTSSSFYPTWPGLWMMGNLGRAIFSASTSRMWPFSYNRCDESVFDSSNQRVSACNANPGSGLNAFQGRGAPEIDLVEGGGTDVSSSIQIGPGMPSQYRPFDANTTLYPDDSNGCVYSNRCKTPGANTPDVPTAYYAKRRGYKSWYQGMRYASNDYCEPMGEDQQSYKTIAASVKAGITNNTCTNEICPGAFDPHSDLGFIDGDDSKGHWGVNTKGTCFPRMNGYKGAFLCDPDNTDERCSDPRNSTTPKSNVMAPFAYQMDALSANWGVHVGVYTHYHTYQLEWVLGDQGYIRWMLNGHPLFEIPASAIVNASQDRDNSNPVRLLPEEPMYFIMNVAVSDSWGARPPNGGRPCRGDGDDAKVNRICDGFPMHMKIDHIRLYQDTRAGSKMAVGCDPASHPTRQWIQDHIEEYEDDVNRHVDVQGGARCASHDDCTPSMKLVPIRTGQCVRQRCSCTSQFWGGPRCTTQLPQTSGRGNQVRSFGPPLFLSIIVAALAIVATMAVLVRETIRNRSARELRLQLEEARVQKEERSRARAGSVGITLASKSPVLATPFTPHDGDEVPGMYHAHHHA